MKRDNTERPQPPTDPNPPPGPLKGELVVAPPPPVPPSDPKQAAMAMLQGMGALAPIIAQAQADAAKFNEEFKAFEAETAKAFKTVFSNQVVLNRKLDQILLLLNAPGKERDIEAPPG